jgi:acetate kinase
MNILVANLGSTSFKYRLFRMGGPEGEVMLGKGGYERVSDYGPCIDDCLASLVKEGHLRSPDDLDAVGFKTVLGKNLSGCVEADDRVLDALEGIKDVAPAHNPAYAAGIRRFRDKLPRVRLVALFETAFFQWAPETYAHYAVPRDWYDAGIRRNGFHGASHKFIAERSAELLGRGDVATTTVKLYQQGPSTLTGKPLRVISCHLGGSSSVVPIRNGVALGSSFGMSPQSGLPQNNRVGDLDSMAIPFAVKNLGIDLATAERQLTTESGLLGLSGVGNDLRDIREAAEGGNARAQLALDVLVDQIRHWIGSGFIALNGLDALVFTAGIGENNPTLRAAICAATEALGIHLDPAKNDACRGTEADIATADSPARILVIPANEECVIAREVQRHLAAHS